MYYVVFKISETDFKTIVFLMLNFNFNKCNAHAQDYKIQRGTLNVTEVHVFDRGISQ